MNIKQLEKKLRDKERELAADMARTEQEAREEASTETQNGFVSSETKENLLQETTSDWSVFAQVREALQRIAAATFGKCVDCGEKIEDRRLEAVPWTRYCLKHQKQHDGELAERLLQEQGERRI